MENGHKVIFSKRNIKPLLLSIVLNNVPLVQSSYENYLGVDIDEKLNFAYHVKEQLTKVNKSIAVIKQLRTKLPVSALLTIYQYFIRLHAGYEDIR